MTDGRLCYLDFGMMGRIDRSTRQALIRATLHMVNREFDALATDFVTLGLLPEDSRASREDIITALQGACFTLRETTTVAPCGCYPPAPTPAPLGLLRPKQV